MTPSTSVPAGVARVAVVVTQDPVHPGVVALPEPALRVAEGVAAVGGAAEACHPIVVLRIICHQPNMLKQKQQKKLKEVLQSKEEKCMTKPQKEFH